MAIYCGRQPTGSALQPHEEGLRWGEEQPGAYLIKQTAFYTATATLRR